ncbi:uncharacterized protein VICG_01543 [Vittaforma corneae ATCC 50505]|uniref:Uncharacterized protein n=1 Tax=Vittaforma corneae (strain ATCC 50505) TaxID=993615 RepID=L2GKM7_VITCO|nr:uncharacterized protein VICG_01543 [Vittaforma corneae ATCC 50505]ELA41438.1 hypothetical protein VICG_01543 [Vittaforma corneae ATCC 50505]
MLDVNHFEFCLKPQYSKYLFYTITDKTSKHINSIKRKLIVEAIAFDELLLHLQSKSTNDQIINSEKECIEDADVKKCFEGASKGTVILDSFTEDEIDDCIAHLFPTKTIARVIERNSNTIVLGEDAIALFSSIPHGILLSIQNLKYFFHPRTDYQRITYH